GRPGRRRLGPDRAIAHPAGRLDRPSRPSRSSGPGRPDRSGRRRSTGIDRGAGVSSSDHPIRVLLVDDEELVRTGLRAILESEPGLEVVAEAADGAEVPPLVNRHRPDVVVMDVRMPTVDGIAATEHLLRTYTEPPRVLVITTFENDEYVYDA